MSVVNNSQNLKFEKIDNVNCIYGRGTTPRVSSSTFKYIGDFDTYEECAQSSNIDPNAKAITYHKDNAGEWSRQCYSVNDTFVQTPNQNYATCGILIPSSGSSSGSSTDEVIERISVLQDLENKKYDDLNLLLASNPTPDNIAQQNIIMNDIMELTNIRSNLFDSMLAQAQGNTKVNSSLNENIQDKQTIITLKENDLNARKAAIAALEQDVENTKKMIDVNVYFKKQYEARVIIMKYIVLVCFLVIFFVVLMNLGWLPQEMVIVLVVIIILGGGFYIGSLVYDTYQRSNINYDEYNWEFDANKMNSLLSNQPKHKKPSSKDRTCNSAVDEISSKLESAYKSVSSSASSIEDSIKSEGFTNGSGGGGMTKKTASQPLPSASASSISAASTSGTTMSKTSLVPSKPSVQSKVYESFMLSKAPKKYFSEKAFGVPFAMEDNYGKI